MEFMYFWMRIKICLIDNFVDKGFPIGPLKERIFHFQLILKWIMMSMVILIVPNV